MTNFSGKLSSIVLGILLVAGAPGCSSSGSSEAGSGATGSGSVVVPSGPGVVSSFESGLGSSFSMDWRAINDNPAGGVSTAALELVPGGASGSQKALHVTGTAKVQDFPFPFAGAALPLGPIKDGKPAPANIESFSGVRFWVKGNGKRYVFRPHSTEVQDFNFHHYVFTAETEWKKHDVAFSSLVQFDWGERRAWSGKSIAALVFVNYSAPGEDFGAIDLSIDEIELY